MPDTLATDKFTEKANPFEFARWLRAFVECSSQIQGIVLEMSDIVSDPDSTDDERTVAFDAMMEALFPGAAADILEGHRQRLNSTEAAEAVARLRSEEADFAKNLLAYMERKNVTQHQLAIAAGITQPAVSNIINRRCRPQRRTVIKFAEALDVKPDELWKDFEHEARD